MREGGKGVGKGADEHEGVQEKCVWRGGGEDEHERVKGDCGGRTHGGAGHMEGGKRVRRQQQHVSNKGACKRGKGAGGADKMGREGW